MEPMSDRNKSIASICVGIFAILLVLYQLAIGKMVGERNHVFDSVADNWGSLIVESAVGLGGLVLGVFGLKNGWPF